MSKVEGGDWTTCFSSAEPVAVNLMFKNQLQVMLNMVRMSLLWRFTEVRKKCMCVSQCVCSSIWTPHNRHKLLEVVQPLR